MKLNAIEKRVSLRLEIFIGLTVTGSVNQTEWSEETLTYNLSDSGMLFTLQHHTRVGEMLGLTVELNGRKISLKNCVVRTKPSVYGKRVAVKVMGSPNEWLSFFAASVIENS